MHALVGYYRGSVTVVAGVQVVMVHKVVVAVVGQELQEAAGMIGWLMIEDLHAHHLMEIATSVVVYFS